jgi:C-terminal processing protease CtpA/Prc
MNTRNILITLISLILFATVFTVSGASHQREFYGDFMKMEHYLEYDRLSDSISDLLEKKDYQKALDLAEKVINDSPEIDRGYYLKLAIGMHKEDIDIVRQSLDEMTGKYVLIPGLYKEIMEMQGKAKNDEFKRKAGTAIDAFFSKRETFLKDKLKYKVSRKTILKELILINDLMGDEEEFLVYAKELLPYDYGFIRRFPDKRKNPEDKRFKELKSAFQKKLQQWSGTTVEKIEMLMRVASELRYWNASLDFSEITDWNSHAASYIPQMLAAKTKTRVYEILSEMIGKVGEDHTRVWFPKDIRSTYSGCGVKFIYANGKYLVRTVENSALKKKIQPGDEIISIDNTPVLQYIEKNKSTYPFVGWYFYKPKIHAFYKIAGVLLSGKKDSFVTAGFKTPAGKRYSLTLKRDAYKAAKKAKPEKKENRVELTVLEGNILYVNIKEFWGSDIYKDFMELIKDTDTAAVKGVIFDLRENGGGNSGYGDSIFSHFIDQTLNNYIFSYHPVRNIRRQSTQSLGSLSLYRGGAPIQPAKEKKFSCPVVLLISPHTGSAAEDFTFCFKYHKRGTLVGLPSGGGTGMGHPLYLPGGGGVRICLNVDLFFSWRGLQPDYTVDFTPEDIAKGNDPQLKKALDILRER